MYGSSSFIYKLMASSQQSQQQHDEGVVTSPQHQQQHLGPPEYMVNGGGEYEHQRSRSYQQPELVNSSTPLNQSHQQMTASRNPVIHQKSKSAIARQGNNHVLLDPNGGNVIMGRGNSYGHLTLNRPNEMMNGGHYMPIPQQQMTRLPPGPGHVTLSRVNSNGQIPNGHHNGRVVTSPSHNMVVTTSPMSQHQPNHHYLSSNVLNSHQQQYNMYNDGMISPPTSAAFTHMSPPPSEKSVQHRKYGSNLADDESASSRHNSPSVVHQRSKSTPYQGFVV